LLRQKYPSYADLRYPPPLSIRQLQREVVDQDEAILEFMVTRNRTYIFAIDKRRFHAFSVDYPSNELEKDVEALTRPLHRADTLASWDPSVAYRIYSKVIKPVEYFLVGKKAVVIVSHGPLTAVPFEILVSSESHAGKRFWSPKDKPDYLVEKYAFCYAPSAAALSNVRTRKRSHKPGWNLVAFGDAMYAADEKAGELNPGAERLITACGINSTGSKAGPLRSLPRTRKEINEIARIVGSPAQVYFGPQATESLFKKADLTRYNYIHLATHGLLMSSPGKLHHQPAILFSLYGDHENDGFLQLGEVFGLKMNSDLVFVSSCLTPAAPHPSDTQGLMVLARAFLFAGTDAVILGMWQVNDESTSKLFVETYRNLVHEPKAEALRAGKLALLKNSATSHPYYWAPFILIGNWQARPHPSTDKEDPEMVRFKGPASWRKWLNM
ncbi:MAG: CHAT domain-containing protein, partial [Deltaproteobacteria bacterium]|nr:CHAT domain-containing protein [Deltaproteobacteria bacterium]